VAIRGSLILLACRSSLVAQLADLLVADARYMFCEYGFVEAYGQHVANVRALKLDQTSVLPWPAGSRVSIDTMQATHGEEGTNLWWLCIRQESVVPSY